MIREAFLAYHRGDISDRGAVSPTPEPLDAERLERLRRQANHYAEMEKGSTERLPMPVDATDVLALLDAYEARGEELEGLRARDEEWKRLVRGLAAGAEDQHAIVWMDSHGGFAALREVPDAEDPWFEWVNLPEVDPTLAALLAEATEGEDPNDG